MPLNFDELKEEFISFLESQGQDARILWVFAEDVYSRKSKYHSTNFWLKLPLPAVNEDLARRHFQYGVSKGFGILLIAFASCEEGLCCSFVVPTDDEDAQYRMIGPGKVRFAFINRDMPAANVVRSVLVWKLMGLLPGFHHKNVTVDLTSKAELCP